MTGMTQPPNSYSDSDDSDNPSHPNSKSTINTNLKHSKVNEKKPKTLIQN